MILNLLFDLYRWQVEEGGLEVETLDEPLHVNSPLGTKVRIDRICRGCELEISGCKTRKNSNFLKKGKTVIFVKIQKFSRYRMTKRTSPLESSREI